MTRSVLVSGLALLAVSAASAGPQEGEPTEEPTLAFPAEIEQVTVDVVVVDKDGQPVTDLGEGDFVVYEDGQRQAISSFEMFEVPVPAVPPPGEAAVAELPAATPVVTSRVSTNADDQERQGRTFVIVFDDVHLTPYTADRAKAAVASFLKTETYEGDRVTLMAPGSGSWWTTRMPDGLDELLETLERQEPLLLPDTQKDRLSDYEAMRIHNFRDSMILDRVNRRYATFGVTTALGRETKHSREWFVEQDPYVTSKAAEVYYQAAARNHATLGGILRALNALVRIQGRKSMILVSEGFIYDPQLREFKKVLSAARRANTAVYFLAARGLDGLPLTMDAEFSQILPQEDLGFAFAQEAEMTEGSISVAADTGGFTVRNNNDLAAGLKRIADETRAYYLIGYNPTNSARDGRFRGIEVKIENRKDLRIRARRGYYAPSQEDEDQIDTLGTDPVFQMALDSPYHVDDIGLRMTHIVREETFLGRARVYVAAEVDLGDLEFEEQDGLRLIALNYLMVTVHRKTGEYVRHDQRMDLRLPVALHARLSRTWLPIVRDFELEPGHYRAKIVLRDKKTQRLGTVTHDFEVPDLTEFRVSTPLLSDMRETTPEGLPGGRVAIMVRREFVPESQLFCELHVYRATRPASSGMPRVSMAYEVRRADGTLFTNGARRLIVPTEAGALSRMIGFSLERATPGDYELSMTVEDEASGKKVEMREPFTVVQAPGAPAVDARTVRTPSGG